MKMKSKFFGNGAKLALAVLAVCGTLFTSCYEKAEVDQATKPAEAKYYIAGTITDATTGQELTTAKVTLGDKSVTSSFNEQVNYKAEGYALVVSADGYYPVKRQVYLNQVSDGQTSVATVNVALVSVEAAVIPPVVPPTDPETDINEGEATKVADKAVEVAKPSESTVTDMLAGTTATPEEKKALDETLEMAGGMKVGETTPEVLADGSILAITPVKFTNPIQDAPAMVPYFYNEGCELTGDVKEVAAPVTRADGAVSADIQKAFLSNAAKALEMNAGFAQKIGYTRISVLNGYSILGYTIKGQLVSKKLTFLISGKYYEGIVSYQKSVMIYPNYYSHDSHDSHDSHGFNPNAGGGSND